MGESSEKNLQEDVTSYKRECGDLADGKKDGHLAKVPVNSMKSVLNTLEEFSFWLGQLQRIGD